jgi:hypothetical protein
MPKKLSNFKTGKKLVRKTQRRNDAIARQKNRIDQIEKGIIKPEKDVSYTTFLANANNTLIKIKGNH